MRNPKRILEILLGDVITAEQDFRTALIDALLLLINLGDLGMLGVTVTLINRPVNFLYAYTKDAGTLGVCSG